MRKAILLVLCLSPIGCSESRVDDRIDVDTILHNAKVITIDADSSIASAVAVDGSNIVAVGGEELLERYRSPNTLDLGGRVLMPGFVDTHVHLRGRPSYFIDLEQTRSIEELTQQVRDKAAELGPGQWITGEGWSEDVMAEGRRPLRSDLDAAAPENPVLLARAGSHSAVANSLALQLAKITVDTPQPEGGVIERGDDGQLNGIIRERWRQLILALVSEPAFEAVRANFVSRLKSQLSLGITSITQAAGRISEYHEWEDVYAQHSGSLPRATVQRIWETPEAMAEFRQKTGDGNDDLRVGPVKLVVDGGFTGPAAYTKEPYKGQGSYRGSLNFTSEELSTAVREAHDAGWQLGLHAIGDAAIELTVDAIAAALDAAPRTDHRHYLNHFTVMPSVDTMEKMAKYDIAISQQPNFTYTLEGRYSEYLDGKRLEHNNSLRTPMNHGIRLAISSDNSPIGPMVGIYAAVTRKGTSGRVFGADEALTVMEALRAYTLEGAWLQFDDDRKGSIEPGKLADMVVLDQDILTIDPERILDVNVDQTWLGGRLVYER